MHLLEFSTGEVSGEAAEVSWGPETVQSGGNSTELNTFSASGVERWEFFFAKMFCSGSGLANSNQLWNFR